MTNEEMIRALLKEYTPATLNKKIAEEQEKENKEREAAKREARLKEKRAAAVNALNDYVEALYGERMNVAVLAALNEEFKKIERTSKPTVKYITSDDEKLKQFLANMLG